MAFPVVQSRITGGGSNTNAATHAITMPSGVLPGELIVVVFSVDGIPTVTEQTTTAWTKLGQASDATSAVTGAIFWKRATGVDTLTLATSANEASSHVSLRLTNAGTPTGVSATGSSTNSNPPAHTPAGGAQDYLWVVTRAGDATVAATVAPTSFANLQTIAASGTGGASTNTAERSLNAATLDPATFTSATEQWVSYTLSVPPAASQSFTTALVAATSTVSPVASVAGIQSRTMALVAATSAVFNPASVAGPAAQSRTMALVAATSAVLAPASVTVQLRVLPTLVASTATVALPAPLRLAQRLRPLAVPDRSLSPSENLAPSELLALHEGTAGDAAVVYGPTLNRLLDQTHTIALVGPSATGLPPTPLGQSVPPTAVVASTATVPGPTVLPGPATVAPLRHTATPSLGLAASSTLAPSTTLAPAEFGGGIILNPTAALGAATVSPAPVGPSSTVREPVLAQGGILPPALVAAASQVYGPRLTVEVRPAAVPSSATVLNPVLGQGAVALAPAVVQSGAVVAAPGIITGPAIVLPAPLSSTVVVPGPFILTNEGLLQPAPVTAASAALPPTVSAGSIGITLDRVDAVPQVFDPDIIALDPPEDQDLLLTLIEDTTEVFTPRVFDQPLPMVHARKPISVPGFRAGVPVLL